MKMLSVILAAASLAALAAPVAAQCTCVSHHRVIHRVFRHAPVRHTRVIVREVDRPVYVDRSDYRRHRPEPEVIDEERYVEPGPWVGPPIRHHRHWRARRWHDEGQAHYDREWRGDDDWRTVAVVSRF